MTEEQATAVINALFESHYAPLVRYACRFTGSLPDAEDIVQDAFTQLYRQLREGKSVDNPAGWAVCVVRRQALSGRRENLEQTVPPACSTGPPPNGANRWRLILPR
jgi:RNA polymerase sigma factor (sigma-70 family)